MKILIVDDFSTMRRIIKNLLRDLGLNNTHEADDGNTALPMLKNGDFEFVVTDWLLHCSTTPTMFLPISCTSPFTVAGKILPCLLLAPASFAASINGRR